MSCRRSGSTPTQRSWRSAHVGHIDDEALKLALKSDCLYVGALGSQRNHAKRRERLLEAGLTEEQIGKIRAPIGIDIGAQTPAEIAVSVMAEIIRAVQGTEAGEVTRAASGSDHGMAQYPEVVRRSPQRSLGPEFSLRASKAASTRFLTCSFCRMLVT